MQVNIEAAGERRGRRKKGRRRRLSGAAANITQYWKALKQRDLTEKRKPVQER